MCVCVCVCNYIIHIALHTLNIMYSAINSII